MTVVAAVVVMLVGCISISTLPPHAPTWALALAGIACVAPLMLIIVVGLFG